MTQSRNFQPVPSAHPTSRYSIYHDATRAEIRWYLPELAMSHLEVRRAYRFGYTPVTMTQTASLCQV